MMEHSYMNMGSLRWENYIHPVCHKITFVVSCFYLCSIKHIGTKQIQKDSVLRDQDEFFLTYFFENKKRLQM